MELEPEDMVYNSREIKEGELRALDLFLRTNLKLYQSDQKFEIEDLLSDQFFESDSLNDTYNDVMDNFLGGEVQILEEESKKCGFL
jgi:hypothetical protein